MRQFYCCLCLVQVAVVVGLADFVADVLSLRLLVVALLLRLFVPPPLLIGAAVIADFSSTKWK